MRAVARVMVGVVVLAASTVVSVTAQSPEEPAPGEARAGVVFTYPLESPAGQQVTGVLVEYGPGGASRPHHHTMRGSVVAYVLEGAVRSRVNGGPVTVYEVGESWVEPPGAAHSVSENASSTEPARVLAVFVAEVGAELTTFDP